MKIRFIYVFALMALVTPLVVCAQTAGSASGTAPSTSISPSVAPADGRALFLHNCAHCHAADATGDEGPDLHHLELTDQEIANRIRKGKAGEMTAFAGKLSADQTKALVAYVQNLK